MLEMFNGNQTWCNMLDSIMLDDLHQINMLNLSAQVLKIEAILRIFV